MLSAKTRDSGVLFKAQQMLALQVELKEQKRVAKAAEKAHGGGALRLPPLSRSVGLLPLELSRDPCHEGW